VDVSEHLGEGGDVAGLAASDRDGLLVVVHQSSTGMV
jgi:hypothetical protein